MRDMENQTQLSDQRQLYLNHDAIHKPFDRELLRKEQVVVCFVGGCVSGDDCHVCVWGGRGGGGHDMDGATHVCLLGGNLLPAELLEICRCNENFHSVQLPHLMGTSK